MSLSRRHYSESGAGLHEALCSGGVNSITSDQLSLELKLQENCRLLLHSYKESQDWSAVGQLAQTLVTSTTRIKDLKRRLEESRNHAPLPFLEKISESDNSNYRLDGPQQGAFDGVKASSSTAKEPSEVEQDKPTRPPSLSKAVESATIKQASFNSCLEGSGEFPPGSESVQQKGALLSSPQESSESKLCASPPEELSSQSSTEALSAAQQQPTSVVKPDQEAEDRSEQDSTPVPNQTEESDCECGVNDIDKMMENLADQFSDLMASAHPTEEGPKPAELVVPGQAVSSGSSEEFFSPRASLYSEGEVWEDGGSDDKEAEQFLDAVAVTEDTLVPILSTKPVDVLSPSPPLNAPPAVDILLPTPSTNAPMFSVTRMEDSSKYTITSRTDAAKPMLGAAFPLIVHSYAEFEQLHQQLAQLDPQLPQCEVEDSGLEELLNLAVHSPSLRETQFLLDFLNGWPHCKAPGTYVLVGM